MSRNPYHVAGTFDSRTLAVADESYFYRHVGKGKELFLPVAGITITQRTQKLRIAAMRNTNDARHFKLPNAPIRAKDTLLAERLRHNPTLIFEAAQINAFHHSNRAAWDTAQRARNGTLMSDRIDVKKIKALVGRLIGIEIEFYPGRAGQDFEPGINPLVRIGSDGSIGDNGREIRKITWQDRDGRLAGVYGLPLKGSHVDDRCGLHIHVDVRHMSPDCAKLTYDLLTESYPVLQELVPSSRLRNKYCFWDNNREGSSDFTRNDRYTAINWLAYAEHRTLEFRCQAGQTDPKIIERWALFCQWLTNFTASTDWPITTFRELSRYAPENLKDWLKDWRKKCASKSSS